MILLWSGGADSTLVLYRELERRHMAPRVLSIEYPNVPAKIEQRRARKAITAELAKRGFHFEHRTLTITSDIAAEAGCTQKVIWLTHAMPFLRESEDLVVSWIAGEFDDAAEARALFKASAAAQGGKRGALLTPLEHTHKPAIVKELRQLELLDLTWSCEKMLGPDEEVYTIPCMRCNKCVEIETAKWQLERFAGAGHVPAP